MHGPFCSSPLESLLLLNPLQPHTESLSFTRNLETSLFLCALAPENLFVGLNGTEQFPASRFLDVDRGDQKPGDELPDFSFKSSQHQIAIDFKFATMTYVLSLEKGAFNKKLIQKDYRVQNSNPHLNDLIREIIPWVTI